MPRVTASAPTRIDLAGGTIDLWPIHQILPSKATVNVAVTLEAQVTVIDQKSKTIRIESQDQGLSVEGTYNRFQEPCELPLVADIVRHLWRSDLPGLHIATSAKSPAGAGLGGSSCLAITIIGALWRMRQAFEGGPDLNEHKAVQIASDIEARIIHAPTGVQDYWGAVRGAINILTYPPGEVSVKTKTIGELQAIDDQLIVCFSGKSRQSAINNWEIFKRVFDNDKALIATLSEIGDAAAKCAEAIENNNFSRAMLQSRLEWQLRTKLWPNIETVETKRLDEAARKAGASFSRVCGAGGGGVMAVFADPAARERVCAALIDNGGVILKAQLSKHGLRVHLTE